MSRHAGKLAEQLLRRAAPRERRPDQNRVRPRGRGLSYILSAADAALRYGNPISGDSLQELPGRLDVDSEGVQIPAVNAHNVRLTLERLVQLGQGMDLDQGIQ